MQPKKELNPDTALESVLERRRELAIVQKAIESRLKNAPDGVLRITERNGIKQYYQRKNSKDTVGKYIRRNNQSLAIKLAQKDYDKKVLLEIQRELQVIDTFLNTYNTKSIENVYDSLLTNKKELVHPLILDDNMYKQRWLSEEYFHAGFKEDSPEYYTENGERVRSKSEIIIANKLWQMGVPYRYEYPIEVSFHLVFHTDFYCLNLRTRKEYAWEHFGMMDNPTYANNAIKKIEAYEKAGFWLGSNLIATFETSENPLNIKILEKTIQNYLM